MPQPLSELREQMGDSRRPLTLEGAAWKPAARPCNQTRTEMATFGAGCFWQVEAAFQEVPGVIETAVGYEGGHVDNPTYEQVCTGTTGHVEVCQLNFDPTEVEYQRLVQDCPGDREPTQLDRRGRDRLWGLASVIFTHSDEQAEMARRVLERAQERFRDPIMTTVEPAQPFWRAEGGCPPVPASRSAASAGCWGRCWGR